MENTIRSLLRKTVRDMESHDILKQPITSIIGLGTNEKITLEFMNIYTIGDLALNVSFKYAFDLCYEIYGETVPSSQKSVHELASTDALLSLKQIDGLDEKSILRLQKHLNIENILDLAQWGPYNIARYLHNIASSKI